MKLLVDIPKKIVTAIQNGEDYRYDIHTAIAQGIPCEESSGDLISREALKKCAVPCETHNGSLTDLCVPLCQIDNALSVETSKIEYKAYNEGFKDGVDQGIKLSERPQGKWIRQYGKSYKLITTDEGTLIGEFTKCPKCLYDKARGSNFCPNCGADMRG